jgi:hypothetical protein
MGRAVLSGGKAQDATLISDAQRTQRGRGVGAPREAQQSNEIASDEREPGTAGTALAARFF